MKIVTVTKQKSIEIVSYLYIVLFTYAATSKLLDYESFSIQLGQSPLLSAFAGWISWFIPGLEILIAIFLMFTPTRFFALIASFFLMVMFSAYILIILNFSEFVPCSCGGILEKMTWNQHLAFNLVFCFLAVLAIVFSAEEFQVYSKVNKSRRIILPLFLSTVFAISLVIIIFITSEQIIHQENNFVRRYPPHLYAKTAQLSLKYDGYYFAGTANNIIYMGNYTSPLSILAVNQNLKIVGNYRIELDKYDLPFRSAKILIVAPYFYLTDGTVPCVFKGKINDWKAKLLPDNKIYFSAIETIDSTTAVFRGKSPKTGETILGTMTPANQDGNIKFGSGLLQKQIDGIFDCDGMLHYNSDLQKLIYLYYYRNQFIVADNNLQLSYRGNTIDTTKYATLKIATLHNGDRKLAAPPFIVNKFSTSTGNQLFVNSNLRGRFESLNLWKQTSVIDVYDLNKNVYDYSFYVYPVNNKKLHAMYAIKNTIYFIIDKALVAYQIDKSVRR